MIDVSNIPLSNFGYLDFEEGINPKSKIHQQDDGTILAIAATGTSSQESLLLWLRKLEQHNPRLRSAPIVVTPNNFTEQKQSLNEKTENNFQKNFDYNTAGKTR